MENNKDEILTALLREKIQSMKHDNNDSAKEGAATLIIAFFLAIAKWGVLTLITWIGWLSLCKSFALPEISYINMFLIFAGIRSLSMLLIDPLTSKKKKD